MGGTRGDRGLLWATRLDPEGTHSPSSPGVTYAATGYFDALVKMGELASESQGSKELGKTRRRRPARGSGPASV